MYIATTQPNLNTHTNKYEFHSIGIAPSLPEIERIIARYLATKPEGEIVAAKYTDNVYGGEVKMIKKKKAA